MGRRRQPSQQAQAQQQQSSLESQIAAAIALVLAGRAAPDVEPAVVIASLLRLLPRVPETDEDGTVTSTVARLVVRHRPRLVERPAASAARRASTQNLSYRAHYAIEADKRVAERVFSGEGVAGALEGERRHFLQHLEANRARSAGAKLNDAAAERWGPLLSWNHPGKTDTHRPSHVAANGANYRIDAPPVSTDGLLPGMALHCECVPGPPIQGARLLL